MKMQMTANQLDIRHEALTLIKTVVLLEKQYAANYLARIVCADERYEFRSVDHRSLETFGELDGMYPFKVENLIAYLVEANYLEVGDIRTGTLKVSEKGMAFYKIPTEMPVDEKAIGRAWYDIRLERKLKAVRKEFAVQEEKSPYEIFTNYVIKQIVKRKPKSALALRDVPGINRISEACEKAVLACIQNITEIMARNEQDGIFTKVFSSRHRQIGKMFREGMTPEEITLKLNVQQKTVNRYLFELHQVCEIDLSSWIETKVEAKDLHRGTDYFKSVEKPYLKEAKRVLELDYPILELCKAHATHELMSAVV